MKPKETIKFVASHLGGGGWAAFAIEMKEFEAEASARRVSRECEAEEVQRLGELSTKWLVDVGYLQRMPYVPGNQFVEGGKEQV